MMVALNFSILAFAVLSVWEPRIAVFLPAFSAKVVIWWWWASTLVLPVLLIRAAVKRRQDVPGAGQASKSLLTETILVFGWLLAFGAFFLVSFLFAPSL